MSSFERRRCGAITEETVLKINAQEGSAALLRAIKRYVENHQPGALR